MKKRKRSLDFTASGPSKSKSCRQSCLVHNTSLKDHGSFTSLDSVKGSPQAKLDFLLQKRDQRMAEPIDSVHRMTSVCESIPESLDGLDLSVYGYHRKCYQYFTKGFDRLSVSQDQAECSSALHSPRKKEQHQVLFPPECIYCDNLEVKVHGRTERPVKFAHWKNKEPFWKKIESMASTLNKTRLVRKVSGVDLFARDAKRHESCQTAFVTEYKNHMRALKPKDSKTSAYNESFEVVICKTRKLYNLGP